MELPIYIKVYAPKGGEITQATEQVRQAVQTGFTKEQGGGGRAGKSGALSVLGTGGGIKEDAKKELQEVVKIKKQTQEELKAAVSTMLYAGGREAGQVMKLPMGVSLPLARYATRLTGPIVAGIEAIGIGTATAIGAGLAAAGVAGVVAYKSWQAREEGQIAYGMQNVLTGASRYMGGASQVSDVAARGTFSKMMGLPGHWLTGSRDAATMGLVSSYTSMPGVYNKGDYSNFATTAKLRGDETGEKLSGQFGKEFTGTDTAFAAGQQSRWIAMQSMASRMNPGEENPALAQAAMAQRELISENRMAWERASTIGMQEHSMDMSHEIQKGIKEEKVKGDSYLSLQSETRKTEQIKAALISNPTLRAQANESIAVQEGQAEKNAINFDVAQKNTALLKAQTNEASEQQDYARKLADYTKDPTITTQGKGTEQIEEDFRKSEKGKDALKKLRESQVTTATAGKTYNLALTSQLDQMAAIEEKVKAGKKGRGVTEAYTTMQTGLETNVIVAKSAESQLQIASGQRGIGRYGQVAAAYAGKQIATSELMGQRSGLEGFQKATGIDQSVNIDRVNQQLATSQWEEQSALKDVYFTAGRPIHEKMAERTASRKQLRQERRGRERLENEFGEYRRTGGKGDFNEFLNTREQGAGTPGQATNELLSFTNALKSATASLASFGKDKPTGKNPERTTSPMR